MKILSRRTILDRLARDRRTIHHIDVTYASGKIARYTDLNKINWWGIQEVNVRFNELAYLHEGMPTNSIRIKGKKRK